jgi:hypothetical protein
MLGSLSRSYPRLKDSLVSTSSNAFDRSSKVHLRSSPRNLPNRYFSRFFQLRSPPESLACSAAAGSLKPPPQRAAPVGLPPSVCALRGTILILILLILMHLHRAPHRRLCRKSSSVSSSALEEGSFHAGFQGSAHQRTRDED